MMTPCKRLIINVFRDTRKFGAQSYLTYLCDRLLLPKEHLLKIGSLIV